MIQLLEPFYPIWKWMVWWKVVEVIFAIISPAPFCTILTPNISSSSVDFFLLRIWTRYGLILSNLIKNEKALQLTLCEVITINCFLRHRVLVILIWEYGPKYATTGSIKMRGIEWFFIVPTVGVIFWMPFQSIYNQAWSVLITSLLGSLCEVHARGPCKKLGRFLRLQTHFEVN